MAILRTVLLASLAILPSSEPTEIGFGTLSGFDYEEGMELPDEVQKLHEVEVTISGFMRREDGDDGPTEEFMLINDACGCDGTPMLHEIIYCTMPNGEKAEMAANPVRATGTLYVGEEMDDGIVIGIYTMDVETIER